MVAEPGISTCNHDQIALARMVMEANATGSGITDARCEDLERGVAPDVYVSKDQCRVLREVLGTGLSAIVTPEERTRLRAARFGDYFIAALAGPDGRNAFRLRRAKTAEMASFFSDVAAIRELGEMGPEAKDEKGQVVKVLLTLMERSGREIILECIDVLGRIVANDSHSLRALNALRKGRDAEIRAASALALKRIRSGGAEPAPAEAAASRDAVSRPEMAPDPLGDRSVAALLKALRHEDPQVGERARAAINDLSVNAYFKGLAAALDHKDPVVSSTAIQELGQLGKRSENIAPRLARGLRHPDTEVRKAALSSLANLGRFAGKAVPELVKILRQEDDALIAASLYVLAKIGPAALPATPDLLRLTNSSNDRVAGFARRAVDDIVPSKNLVRLLNSKDASIRLSALRQLALRPSDSAESAQQIARLLNDPDSDVRRTALSTLSSIGPGGVSAHPVLQRYLLKGDSRLKMAAAYLFEKMGDAAEPAAPALAKALGDENAEVRKRAFATLLQLGAKAENGLPELLKQLDNDNAIVRAGAAHLLGRMGPTAEKALPALRKAMQDPEDIVRRKAADAVRTLEPGSDLHSSPEPESAGGERPDHAAAPLPTSTGAHPPAGSPARPEAATRLMSKSEEDQILALVNMARSQARRCGSAGYFKAVGPLRWNDQLAAAALAHWRDMAENVYWSHKGKDGKQAGSRVDAAGYPRRYVAENLGLGQTSVRNAVEAWLNSPYHCRNIMSPRAKEIGVAYFYGREVPEKYRRSDAIVNPIYWTMVLGATR